MLKIYACFLTFDILRGKSLQCEHVISILHCKNKIRFVVLSVVCCACSCARLQTSTGNHSHSALDTFRTLDLQNPRIEHQNTWGTSKYCGDGPQKHSIWKGRHSDTSTTTQNFENHGMSGRVSPQMPLNVSDFFVLGKVGRLFKSLFSVLPGKSGLLG